MRKGIFTRILSMGLALAMCVGLAACGDESDKAGNANSAMAKEHVHSYEKVALGDFGEDTNVSIVKIDYAEGRVYALLDLYMYESGSGIAVTEEAVDVAMSVDPGFGVMPEEEYVAPQYIKRLVSFLPDGTDVQYVDLEMDENASAGYTYLDTNSISFAGGYIFGIANTWISDYSDPENPIEENRQEAICWNGDGTRKWTTDLTQYTQSEEQWLYISGMKGMADGTIRLIVGGDEMKYITLDSEGNQVDEKNISGADMNNISYSFLRDDGTLLVLIPNEDWSELSGAVYDPQTGMLGEKLPLPANIMQYNIEGGRSADLILHNSNGIYTCNLGETELTQIMNFVNSDLDATWVNNVVMIDGEHLVLAYSAMESYEQQIAVTSKVNPEDIPDKKVLVLAGNYLNSSIRKRVMDYNKTNEKYRIIIKDYSEYNTNHDYTVGYTQLNSDIISGNMPDILIADSSVNVNDYISKGWLADIGSLIEKDEELSSVEFMDNVFAAYSVDGKLYQVIPSFTVNTMIAKQSLVGDRSGWNMDDFLATLAAMPEGISGFGEYTRENFLRIVLQYCGTDFIDFNTGECSFHSAEFVKILEYAKTLPEEIIYDEEYNWEQWENQYRDNRTLLMYLNIYNIKDSNYSIYGQFGEEVSFVGFPNASQNGSVINVSDSYVLSATSKDLEGAWDFVRYYLTEEYQKSDQLYQMPVNKAAFMEKAQMATQKSYYLDEEGNKVEYDEYVYINGESIVLPPMTQEQVDKMVAFIETVDRAIYIDEDILNIIQEEAASFLKGPKTAQEAADIIQNRIKVMINE